MSRIVRRAGERKGLWSRIKDVALMDVAVIARGGVREGSLEELEQLLLEADFGVPVTMRLVDEVSRAASRGAVKTDAEFREALRQGVESSLRAGNADPSIGFAATAPGRRPRSASSRRSCASTTAPSSSPPRTRSAPARSSS